jgi:hypothetical protein
VLRGLGELRTNCLLMNLSPRSSLLNLLPTLSDSFASSASELSACKSGRSFHNCVLLFSFGSRAAMESGVKRTFRCSRMGSAHGSLREVYVRQCAAVCGSVWLCAEVDARSSVRQWVAACDSARGSVTQWMCGSVWQCNVWQCRR